ncbi:MAG TPA: shikimate dehydrogenase [Mycobacteriales bacterium]|nr:shikimate dehydrogenase [Mycobacteriales bacterium]
MAAEPGRRAAVAGRPIGHSLSPALHRAAYAALGLRDWRYDALDVGEDDLAALFDTIRGDRSWAGLSMTMPLKAEAVRRADVVDPLAARIGSANTAVRGADGAITVHSTDVDGARAALSQVGERGPVAVLGSGGTARAAVAAVAPDVEVLVVARSAERGDPVAALHPLGLCVGWDDFTPADVGTVVAAVPAGVTDDLAVRTWPATTGLVEVVYDPWPTPLAARALASGARVAGGLVVLVAQAARQVELMTGRTAPLEVMRAAGEAALARS